MKPYEALIQAGGLILWLPPSDKDDPALDTPFLASVRARRDALLAFADGLGPEPEAGWSVESALALRLPSDPSGPRRPPFALRGYAGDGEDERANARR